MTTNLQLPPAQRTTLQTQQTTASITTARLSAGLQRGYHLIRESRIEAREFDIPKEVGQFITDKKLVPVISSLLGSIPQHFPHADISFALNEEGDRILLHLYTQLPPRQSRIRTIAFYKANKALLSEAVPLQHLAIIDHPIIPPYEF